MGQKINLEINSKKYELTANSPDEEEIYRRAAASVNSMISYYTERYPGQEMLDILSFAALNESIARLTLLKRIGNVEKEAELLRNQTDTYLGNIKGQPPATTR